jgi:cellulose synthase/poly-beta-1,6-N-acetylglucosamine synthase-like glycosyltransferase
MAWMHVAIIGALLAVLVQVLLNLRALPRLLVPASGPAPAPGSVSVLVPARNEGARIGACLAAWGGELGPGTELLVLDDESTDDTRARAVAALAGIPRARLLAGAALPAGWAGKSFACHQLAQAARGEILVFADVDVQPRPGLLAALVAAVTLPGTDGVTVLPRHAAGSRPGRHLAPLQAWVAMCFCPLWLRVHRSRVLAVANGQLLAVRRAAYDAVGGHARVGGSLAEDAELGRCLTAAGYRVRLVDGSALVTGAAYERLRDAWHGNVKNLFPVLLHSRVLAWGASAGLVLGWSLPWVMLAARLGEGPPAIGIEALEAGLGLVSRLLVAGRFRHRLSDIWSHPLLVLFLAAMIATSACVYGGGRVSWRGRSYDLRPGASADGALRLPAHTGL